MNYRLKLVLANYDQIDHKEQDDGLETVSSKLEDIHSLVSILLRTVLLLQ